MLLLLPAATVLVAFLYYPALETFRLSPYETLLLGQRRTWTGLGNSVTLLAPGTCQYSFFITIVSVAVVVFGTPGVSLLINYLIFSTDAQSSVYLVAAI